MAVGYLFEAKQIQSYIFATNKLRDASGASELINLICADRVSKQDGTGYTTGIAFSILVKFGIKADVYRATGGVLDIAVASAGALTKINHFRAALRLAVVAMAPGLAFSDGVGVDDNETEARSKARNACGQSGGRSAKVFPLGNPLIRPAPRSGGLPADHLDWTKAGRCATTEEFADLATLAKRNRARLNREDVARQFCDAGNLQWPVNFEEGEDGKGKEGTIFPFGGSEIKRIALIHADGNGVGQLFEEAAKTLEAPKLREMSIALSEATQDAVQFAMVTAVLPAKVGDVMPARPIVLGGDDISLILRADLALPFVRAFVTKFQELTRAALQQHYEPDHRGLTSKVGIVFLGPKQPFGSAYHLCEMLAAGAKDADSSRVAFWRLGSAAIPEAVREIEAQTHLQDGTKLWKRSHTVEEIDHLIALASVLAQDDVGRGSMRQVPDLMRHDPAAAQRVFARSLEVLGRRCLDAKNDLEAALSVFGADKTGKDAVGYCPLWEAHEIGQLPSAVSA